ncbi:MAG: FtsW/RodA/SpoVE family cell cycle protein [Minisyncoccota bacterium]
MNKIKADIPFLISLTILVVAGFLIFSSASLGLLSKNSVKYTNVAFNQTFFGLFLGSLACLVTSKIPFQFYKKNAFFIFIAGIILTLLVFVPSVGVSHGGAKRWVSFKLISFQPSEILKITYIIYFAAWISRVKDKVKTISHGLLPFIIITGIVGAILLAQPDTDIFMVTLTGGLAIFLAGGGRWRHLFLLLCIGVVGFGAIAYTRPYVMSRITTFMSPEKNSQGSGYQIQQSLIAVGSGGLYGRGFGQSIQKFNFLPEPIGDSIFAVSAEEFGFIGSTLLILLFVFFALRGLKIAASVHDPFGRLLVVGIVILIISQAFVNIGAMIGILPLSGITLPFVSHGGTALFIVLAEAGIILNVSKSVHKKH